MTTRNVFAVSFILLLAACSTEPDEKEKVFTHAELDFSLTFPSSWTLDEEIENDEITAYRKSAPGGVTVLAVDVSFEDSADLAEFVESWGEALQQGGANAEVLPPQRRDGVLVMAASYDLDVEGDAFRTKTLFFVRGDRLVMITLTARADDFGEGSDMRAIEASLTFAP